MKIISVFNNKGGVGKSTLTYHLGCALGSMNKRVLLVDLDPQCNLTICGMSEEDLHTIWEEEDPFIDDFQAALDSQPKNNNIINSPRSFHFLLKPAEDGLNELTSYPPPVHLYENVDLLPGRLSIHKYENKIAERWSGAYQGDNLSIRTITNVRRICEKYSEIHSYDYVLVDTSPSLGIFNKIIISTVDGFFIPAQPDMFSLYGIRNIGNSLEQWQKEFNTIYRLISNERRSKFPQKFVQCLGFTIYNAKKYSKMLNPYNLANAHYAYALKIPKAISEYINPENRVTDSNIDIPIGQSSIMHTHNTYPSVSQALKCPMWLVPEVYKNLSASNPNLSEELLFEVNRGSYSRFEDIKDHYIEFANDFITRVEGL